MLYNLNKEYEQFLADVFESLSKEKIDSVIIVGLNDNDDLTVSYKNMGWTDILKVASQLTAEATAMKIREEIFDYD